MARNIEIRVGIFVITASLVLIAAVGFFAYKKDLFTRLHTFTLSARVGDDLSEGMPVIFSGFKIGKVQTLELNDAGVVIIKIRIPDRHVTWLRQNSIFTVDKPLLGSARLLVASPEPLGPPLTSKMVPEVVIVNSIAEITKKVQPILERVTQIADHLEQTIAQIASPQGDLNKILKHTGQLTAKLSQKNSILEMAVNDQKAVQAVHESLRKTRDLAAQLDAILKRVDTMAKKTDEALYGREGLLPQVNKVLKDTQLKLDKLSVSLDNVNKITGDIADSTTNIKRLRSDLDSTVGNVNELVTEINRKIPFRKQPEIKLP